MTFSSEPFLRRSTQDQDERDCRQPSEGASADWHLCRSIARSLPDRDPVSNLRRTFRGANASHRSGSRAQSRAKRTRQTVPVPRVARSGRDFLAGKMMIILRQCCLCDAIYIDLPLIGVVRGVRQQSRTHKSDTHTGGGCILSFQVTVD